MNTDEQEAITLELLKMYPEFRIYEFEEQYRICYLAYNRLPDSYKHWTLEEYIDPRTFESTWKWRRKT